MMKEKRRCAYCGKIDLLDVLAHRKCGCMKLANGDCMCEPVGAYKQRQIDEQEIQKLKEELETPPIEKYDKKILELENQNKKLRDALKVLVGSIDKSCEDKLISNSGKPIPTGRRDYHDRTCEYHKLTKIAKKALEGDDDKV